MKLEDDKEAELGQSWPPSIPRSGTGKLIRSVNYRKPGAWAWAVIWALAIGRTLLLWACIAYTITAGDTAHSDPSAMEAFFRVALPEMAVLASCNDRYHLDGSVIPWIITTSVFFCTFVFAYLFRVFVSRRCRYGVAALPVSGGEGRKLGTGMVFRTGTGSAGLKVHKVTP